MRKLLSALLVILCSGAMLAACSAGGSSGSATSNSNSSSTYSVTYIGNGNTGGSAPIDSIDYQQGQTVIVLGNTGGLVNPGYSFVGWNTQVNGSGISYTQGQTFIMGSANVTLYAKWTANTTYTVTYSGNGNTGGNVPIDATNYEQGQTVTVLGNTGSLVNPGYSFIGWNTQVNGSGITYTQGQTFMMGSANVTLYAKWTTNTTYTVTYNGNGNTGGNVPIDTTYYEQGQTVTVLGNTGNLVNTGYSFAGWNTLSNGTGTTYTQAQTFIMGSANVTLYAKWVASASSAPTGLTAIAGNNQVSISWNPVASATSYNLYWSTTSGVSKSTGTLISNITSTTYTHTGLTAGTTYYYIITAVDSSGESLASVQVSATPPLILASGLSSPTNMNIALDSNGNIYWNEIYTIKEMPTNGGAIKTIVSSSTNTQKIIGFTIDSTSVYFTTTGYPNGNVEKAPIIGGSITLLAPYTTPINEGYDGIWTETSVGFGQIVVDTTNVWWLGTLKSGSFGYAGISNVGLNGGTPNLLGESYTTAAPGFAEDSTTIYFCASTYIMKSLKSGAASSSLTAANYSANAIAVDSNTVYWTDVSGYLYAVSINGGTVTTLASANGANGIAIDSNNVYWTEYTSGNVKMVSKNGGTVTTIAAGLNFPFGIAVDSTSVYWAEIGAGSIKKSPK
jgi:uncharacterized repeat protein (TIGR02543 family)